MRRGALTATAAVTSLAFAAAGCGSSGGSSSTAPSSSSGGAAPAQTAPSGGTSSGGKGLKISADPNGALKFNTTALKAKSGSVTITMTNPSTVQHGVAIQGGGVNKSGQIVGDGGTSTVTATLKPGKYTFYCPVPGHRQAGMQGTLTVK